MDEAERIAKGLTKAQRESFVRSTTIGCVTRTVTTAAALVRLGLATCEYELQPRTLDWTPLGLEVRESLQNTPGTSTP